MNTGGLIGMNIEQFGLDALAERFKVEVRAFQREQRRLIRKAANVVKADVIAKVRNQFPSSRGPHKGRGGKMIGPLDRSIGVRVLTTTTDVAALIRPRAKAFYGRFQETGLDVMRKSRSSNAVFISSRKPTRGRSPFRLPAKPFLEPVAQADADKVADIMGESYGVFFSGGS